MSDLTSRVFEVLGSVDDPRFFPTGPLLTLGERELCWTADFLQFASDGSSLYIFDDPERVALRGWNAAVERQLEIARLYLRQPPPGWRVMLDWVLYRGVALLFMVFVGLNLGNAWLFFTPLRQVLPSVEWLWLLGWSGEVTFATLILKLAFAAGLLSTVSLLQRRTIALRFDAWRCERSIGWEVCLGAAPVSAAPVSRVSGA